MAAPIVGLTAVVNFSLTGTGFLVDPLQGNIPLSGALNISQNFANASPLPSGAVLADQMRIYPITIAASGTVTVDLLTALANIVQNSAATFDKIACLVLYLPTVAKAPAILGITAQASGVSVGNAASDPFLGIDTAGTDPKLFVPGRYQIFGDTAAGAYASVVTGACNLKLVNTDSVNAATFLIGMLGQQA